MFQNTLFWGKGNVGLEKKRDVSLESKQAVESISYGQRFL
jgi:hypothetical protein